MGELIDLFSREELTDSPKLIDPATHVQAVFHDNGVGDLLKDLVVNPELEVLDVDEAPFGQFALVLLSDPERIMKYSTRLAAGISDRFYDFLEAQEGVDGDLARAIVQRYAYAMLSLNTRAIYDNIRKKTTTVTRIARSLGEKTWGDRLAINPMRLLVSAAAGFVALEGTDFAKEGFDFAESRPYPDHIAALADPLSKKDFRELLQKVY